MFKLPVLVFLGACAWQCSAVPAQADMSDLDDLVGMLDLDDLDDTDEVINPILELLDELIEYLTSTVFESFPELKDLYFPDDLGPFSDVIDRLSYVLFLSALYLAGSIPLSDLFTSDR